MTAPPHSIDTERFILRPFTPADAPNLQDALAASRPELLRWTPWGLEGSDSLLALEARLEREQQDFLTGVAWRYGIFDRDEPAKLLGGCGLFARIGPGALEVGYWVATRAVGRGVATEAARALTAEAFRLEGIDRVEMRCAPENVRSMRVPERLGFRRHPELVHVEAKPGRPATDLVMWEARRTG